MRFDAIFFLILSAALFWMASDTAPNLDFTLDEQNEQVAIMMIAAGIIFQILGLALLCARNPNRL